LPLLNFLKEKPMKKLLTVLFAGCLSVAMAGARAADDMMKKDDMKKDAMKKDTMSKDAMKKDTMGKDAMKKDDMKK